MCKYLSQAGRSFTAPKAVSVKILTQYRTLKHSGKYRHIDLFFYAGTIQKSHIFNFIRFEPEGFANEIENMGLSFFIYLFPSSGSLFLFPSEYTPVSRDYSLSFSLSMPLRNEAPEYPLHSRLPRFSAG